MLALVRAAPALCSLAPIARDWRTDSPGSAGGSSLFVAGAGEAPPDALDVSADFGIPCDVRVPRLLAAPLPQGRLVARVRCWARATGRTRGRFGSPEDAGGAGLFSVRVPRRRWRTGQFRRTSSTRADRRQKGRARLAAARPGPRAGSLNHRRHSLPFCHVCRTPGRLAGPLLPPLLRTRSIEGAPIRRTFRVRSGCTRRRRAPRIGGTGPWLRSPRSSDILGDGTACRTRRRAYRHRR